MANSCTLSRGTEEEIQVRGFTPSLVRQLLTALATLLTAGLPLLLFRWKPGWRLTLTCRQELLALADRVAVLHVESGDETVEQVVEQVVEDHEDVPREWRRTRRREQTTDRSRLLEEAGSKVTVRFFICRHIRYVWSDEKGAFNAMFGLAGLTGSQICQKSTGITEQRAAGLRKVYGANSISAPVPSYMALLVEEVLNPFYIFQLCSIILWSFDEYVFYAVCIFIISLISVIISLVEMRQQAEMLHGLVAEGAGGGVDVLRGDVTSHVEGEMLAPGDVVKLPPQGCVLPCDAVLLTGSAIVNEAMLTGESVPVTKVFLGEEVDLGQEIYSPDTHRRQTIFAGTEVIQTRYYGNQAVLAMVVRTGFTTAKGELIRSIMFPKPMDFKFYRDSMRFIGLLFVVAACGMAYCVYMYVKRGVIWQMILLRSLDIITIVVPPALPAAMTVGTYYAQARLKKHRIYCLSPARINVCGKLKLVCFDKTGTLTEEGLSLWGVIPCNDALLDKPTPSVQNLDRDSMLVSCLAACHSLITIEGQLSGDPMDLKMFEATGWELVEGGNSENENYDQMMPTMVRPKSDDLEDSWKLALEIGIIRQFTFTSNLARMSVIAKKLRSSHFMVLVKGAPERLEPLCLPESLPPDFSSQLASLANSGHRVVALAGKDLQANFLKVQKLTREEAEKDLMFLGFLVMQNTLKPESVGVIRQLRAASLRCLMVTGDNLLTAVSVARDCGLIGDREEAITMSAEKEEDGSQRLLFEAIGGGQNTGKEPKLAITGRTWSIVRQHFPELVPRVLLRTVVWARMSPDQKAQLVEALQDLGYVAAMCGDGANDCGALKAAHVGVSLSEAEASVAAPFTSAVPNISCIPSLVREGRCALVTSFGVFKYMALYSMIQFASVLILYSNKTNLGDTQFLYIDLVITTTIAVLMGRTGPLDNLSKERPPGSLVTGPTLASILAQVVLCFLGQFGSMMYLHLRPWWTPVDPANPEQEITVNFDTTTVFVVSAFQYISIATVFSNGPPFRAPLYKNRLYSLALLLLSATTVILLLNIIPALSTFFSLLVPFPNEQNILPFKWMLLMFIIVNFLANWGVEVSVNSGRWVKKVFHCLTMKRGPRNKYKIVQKTLEEEEEQLGQWPRNFFADGYR